MPTKRIICLANSRKHGQRCVAGIDWANNTWVRFVKDGGAELTIKDIAFQNEEQPKLLDIIDVPVLHAQPLYYQPENWVIDDEEYWIKVGEVPNTLLGNYCTNNPRIFMNNSDRLTVASLQRNPIANSIVLIQQDDIVFQKTWRNYRQIRAKFFYNGNNYNFAVTDTEWEEQFNDPRSELWEFGDYLFKGSFYLTIGLGSEFRGNHYKLVVAVIPIVIRGITKVG